MSDDRPTDEEPREDQGGLAPAHGTPVPVDVSTDRRVRMTWAIFLAGPIIWLTHFMAVYLVAEAGCTGDGPGLWLFDPPVPVVTTLVATVIAVALCVAATVWAFRHWRDAARELEEAPDDAEAISGEYDDDRRRGSLALAGFLLGAFSVVAVLFTGTPALVLGPC